jgi:protein gp37
VPFRRGPGSRPIVFPCDLSDLFHPEVPDEFILAALHVMAQRDDVDWTVLTKRVDRMAFFDLMYLSDGFPPNVWVGATVENEKRALERAGKLLKVCARVHWLSMEPLLEATSISRWLRSRPDCVHIDNDDGTCFHPGNPTPECNVGAPCPVTDTWQGLNWVVVGAESGSSRRSFSVAWAERIHRECETAGVPFFGKQDSGFHPGVPLLIDGREVKKFPA